MKARKIIIGIILFILISASLIFTSLIPGEGTITSHNRTQSLELIINKNAEMVWSVGQQVDMKSLKLDGVVSTIGTAKVFVENDNTRYLVLDSSILKQGASATTGLAITNKIYRLPESPTNLFFEGVCFETCSLNEFDKSSYKLVFDISGGAILGLKKIDYTKAEGDKAKVIELPIIRPPTVKLSPKPWMFLPIILIPIILIAGLVIRIVSKRSNNAPKEFQEKLKQIAFLSKTDLRKAIGAYNELKSMYEELIESETSQKVRVDAYKAVEKSYESLKKMNQN
jgi:hypothetical protein